jgi:hypothetical protein
MIYTYRCKVCPVMKGLETSIKYHNLKAIAQEVFTGKHRTPKRS